MYAKKTYIWIAHLTLCFTSITRNDFLSLSSTRDFFSLSDGMFLNYHWHRQCLVDTLTVCGKDRANDVFVGIDVFRRGTFGGGGYQRV